MLRDFCSCFVSVFTLYRYSGSADDSSLNTFEPFMIIRIEIHNKLILKYGSLTQHFLASPFSSLPVCEVSFYRGGFPPFYVPSEDMYLWLSACGAVVLLRSVRGGSLGCGSQRVWSKRR